MTITLSQNGDSACVLKQVTPSVSVEFPLPLPKAAVVELLRTILSDPESREVGAGPVSVDRMRDGIRLAVGNGSFTIPWSYALPIVLES